MCVVILGRNVDRYEFCRILIVLPQAENFDGGLEIRRLSIFTVFFMKSTVAIVQRDSYLRCFYPAPLAEASERRRADNNVHHVLEERI